MSLRGRENSVKLATFRLCHMQRDSPFSLPTDDVVSCEVMLTLAMRILQIGRQDYSIERAVPIMRSPFHCGANGKTETTNSWFGHPLLCADPSNLPTVGYFIPRRFPSGLDENGGRVLIRLTRRSGSLFKRPCRLIRVGESHNRANCVDEVRCSDVSWLPAIDEYANRNMALYGVREKGTTMKIYLANPRGFCAGVDRAIDIVDLSLKKYGAPIYVRHEIVHSRHVVNSLRTKGAVFVEELGEVPEGSVVIFSAHGVAKSVWDEANRRRLHVIDATCPLVIKVHNEVNRDYTQGYDLILIGHAGHPEVIGTLGQIPDKFHLVSSVADVEKLQVDNVHDLSYVTQTTLSVDECRDIVGALHERFPHIKGPHQEDICYATQNRQNAVKELSKLVDVILVIGSPNSSNSNRLRELGEQCGIASYLIDAASDINPLWLTNVQAVGITAGASAPEVLVEELVTYLKTFGTAEVHDLTVIEEDVEFLLPKELITIDSSNKSVGAQVG